MYPDHILNTCQSIVIIARELGDQKRYSLPYCAYSEHTSLFSLILLILYVYKFC
jgi:hypothetical protein